MDKRDSKGQFFNTNEAGLNSTVMVGSSSSRTTPPPSRQLVMWSGLSGLTSHRWAVNCVSSGAKDR